MYLLRPSLTALKDASGTQLYSKEPWQWGQVRVET